MNIRSMFGKGKPVFSLEIFPPKRTDGIDTLYSALDSMARVGPAYISVTYGAGATVGSNLTFRLASDILSRYGIQPLVHLTCLHNTRSQVTEQLEELKSLGIKNILALRGDRRPGEQPCTDFSYASDLAEYIRELGDFNIVGACYPEGHPESPGRAEDVRNLKHKIDAGVTHLNSQLFFDNDDFYSFLELCKAAGINVPIEAGIMPVTNKKQIERMVSGCGAGVPKPLARILARYENDPDGLFKSGMEYSVKQVAGLLDNGVDGIHLYSMNKPEVTQIIYESIKNRIS